MNSLKMEPVSFCTTVSAVGLQQDAVALDAGVVLFAKAEAERAVALDASIALVMFLVRSSRHYWSAVLVLADLWVVFSAFRCCCDVRSLAGRETASLNPKVCCKRFWSTLDCLPCQGCLSTNFSRTKLWKLQWFCFLWQSVDTGGRIFLQNS